MTFGGGGGGAKEQPFTTALRWQRRPGEEPAAAAGELPWCTSGSSRW